MRELSEVAYISGYTLVFALLGLAQNWVHRRTSPEIACADGAATGFLLSLMLLYIVPPILKRLRESLDKERRANGEAQQTDHGET